MPEVRLCVRWKWLLFICTADLYDCEAQCVICLRILLFCV